MGRLATLLLTIVLLAGCGGGGDAGADPATALPAGGVYLELVVNPGGEQREEMAALAGKVLRTDDPGRRIVELLESLDDTPGGDYERDVKPWLGERAGLVAVPSDGEDLGWVVAVAASDAGEAGEALERQAARERAKKGRYEDVDYWVDEDGAAMGVAGDFALFADSEAGLRKAIDVPEGRSMAEVKRFTRALEPLPDEREGTIFFDLVTLLEQSPDLGAGGRGLLTFMIGGFPPVALAVLAERDHLAIESRTEAGAGSSLIGLATGFLGATPLLEELPGDAWVAVGARDFGESARSAVNAYGGAIGGAVIAGQLESELGISLERDVYAWMGDAAWFARGTSVESAGGGVVIDVTDREAARRALPKLIGALQLAEAGRGRPVALEGASLAFEVVAPGLPQPVYVALAGERAVVAYGREAAQAALAGGAKLRDGDAWRRAGDVLDGVDPLLVVDVPAALRVAERAAAGDAGFARAKPYLDAVSVVAGGSRRDGDRVRSRLAAGVE